MVDFAKQRLNMVESQVRPSDVTDRRVISAMTAVRRERFVPPSYQAIAYADTDLIVKLGESGPEAALIAPRVLARMIQYLEIGDNAVVLNVAAATGYSTALLARIAQTVVAIDEDDGSVAFAAAQLSDAGIDNAVVVKKPLLEGYPNEGPYDAILINGMVDQVPEGLLDQLKDQGCLVAVETGIGVGHAVQWRRLGDSFDKRWLFNANAPVLDAFRKIEEFQF